MIYPSSPQHIKVTAAMTRFRLCGLNVRLLSDKYKQSLYPAQKEKKNFRQNAALTTQKRIISLVGQIVTKKKKKNPCHLHYASFACITNVPGLIESGSAQSAVFLFRSMFKLDSWLMNISCSLPVAKHTCLDKAELHQGDTEITIYMYNWSFNVRMRTKYNTYQEDIHWLKI